MPEFAQWLDQWVAQGGHATMDFMARYRDIRCNPDLLSPNAKSIICVALGYKPSKTMTGNAKIAQYAYGDDYHETLRRMLFQMKALIADRYPDFDARVCVDSAPIAEKVWAAQAGLGWIGKNTLLVNPRLGSLLCLGELVTSSEADVYDTPMADGCGSCQQCLQSCPNRALSMTEWGETSRPMLDSTRCTSYNTIENRAEQFDDHQHWSPNGYAFGCDCCQMACPYNSLAPVKFEMSDARLAELQSLSRADEHQFRRFSKHSPLSRIKYVQWLRNLKMIEN